MPNFLPTIDLGEVSGQTLPWNLFMGKALAEGLHYAQTTKWDTNIDLTAIDKLTKLTEGRCLAFYQEENWAVALITIDGGGLAWISGSSSHIAVFTVLDKRSEEKHLALVKEVLELFPVATPTDDQTVQVRFWMLGPNGANDRSRRLAVPPWDDIQGNYPQLIQAPLTELMNSFQPSRGGQLVLWHGPPGTGKTFALRALAYSWRHWCDTEYIVDPESFFGSAAYMMTVVMGDALPTPVSENGVVPHPNAQQGRWRLLILEDAGELLAEDARQREGQALSRFLNLADGMIGQGMKVMALVTTNEPLGKLHPAVGRPGRCAAEVEFRPFTVEEANGWLKGREIDPTSKQHTLAELYATVEGFAGAKGGSKKALGIGR